MHESAVPPPETHLPGQQQPDPQDPTTLQDYTFHGLDINSVLTGYIDIQVLDYFSTLLKAQFPKVNGLILPSALYQHVLSNDPLMVQYQNPVNVNVVQIHYVDSHYLVSFKTGNIIKIFDSLYNPDRIKTLMPQLRTIYGNISEFSVGYIAARSQGCSDDCGLFAAANAYFLVKG